MPYLIGPKKVDWQPIKNRMIINKGTDCAKNAKDAQHMMMISASLIRLIRNDFSYLSASWPARAEKRKKGRMKSPAARLTSKPLCPGLPAKVENANVENYYVYKT